MNSKGLSLNKKLVRHVLGWRVSRKEAGGLLIHRAITIFKPTQQIYKYWFKAQVKLRIHSDETSTSNHVICVMTTPFTQLPLPP